ncbi:MAG TPA: glycerol kinase GlpK [Desulfuromonadales bacterium]|nr:glycerol kinase GlpK [Desulfuromonadales bacterium]
MERYILAIDQGTTGSTALLVCHDLSIKGKSTVDFPQHFPRPGWVEHDPEEIWFSVQQAIRRVLKDTHVDGEQIAAIGITNQRETTLLWDRETGRSEGNAIVWQDRRSSEICRELSRKGLEPLFRNKTGLIFDPYFAGTKLTWRLREEDGLREKAEGGGIAFGTVDTFLVWRLTGGQNHVTDVSNASRTLLMDLESCNWDPELCNHLEVPAEILPEIAPSSKIYGHTAGMELIPDGIPVSGMAGDQQAALFGQACFEPGESKCTYGTGAFLLANTGANVIHSENGLLTTVAWQLEDDKKPTYCLEGSAFIAGAAVQWLRDELHLFRSSADIEAMAASVEDSGDVIFVPALTGLGAPHWNSEARGLICGLTRGTTAAHLARATLEGIALQIHDLVTAMNHDRGKPLTDLRVDGGAAQNNLLMQIQADLTELTVIRPQTVETTSLGAAMLAGLGVGFWKSLDELRATWQEEKQFKPDMAEEKRKSLLARWQEALKKV